MMEMELSLKATVGIGLGPSANRVLQICEVSLCHVLIAHHAGHLEYREIHGYNQSADDDP